MFRLAVLSIAAVKAEMSEESMETEMESAAPESRKLYYRPRRWHPTISATITDSYAASKITVKGYQYRSGTVKWVVDAQHLNDKCPGGLNWHIHRGAVDADGASCSDQAGSSQCAKCGAGFTGGHTDPTFGCGGASEYRSFPAEDPDTGAVPYCTTLAGARDGPRDAAGYKTRCGTTPKKQTECEFGDLSGKLGKINKRRSYFFDYHIGDLNNYKGQSLVVHCCDSNGGCSPRAGCANFH